VSITVPRTAPDSISSTLVLQIKGALEVVDVPPMQEADGSVTLGGSDAVLHGDTIRFDGGSRANAITSWTSPSDWAEWTFTISKPGRFAVSANLSAREPASVEAVVGGDKLTRVVTQTDNATQFRANEVGIVQLGAGRNTLSLKAVPVGWSPVSVRSITLRPAQ
jgi:alpha-L-fucosidase